MVASLIPIAIGISEGILIEGVEHQARGKDKGILGHTFTKSQNKITDPANLYKLIALINAEQSVVMGVKDKGDIYEGLLEKNAEDTKSRPGQYFRPRPLINAMVECRRPELIRNIAQGYNSLINR